MKQFAKSKVSNSEKTKPARLGHMLRAFAPSLLAGIMALSAPLLQASPVISSVYPPVLTDRVGDHVAFVASATGTGSLSYQWYQNTTLLSGQTSATLVVTNILTTSAGSYWVAVTDSTGTASNYSKLNVSTNYLPLYPTNLVVARVGDGAQPLSGATGNTLYLDVYTTNGTYVSTTQIPDETPSGPYAAVLFIGAGVDVGYEAGLATSQNQEFLTFVGYDSPYPNNTGDITLTGAHVRGAYGINIYGYYAISYTNAGLYSGGNHTIRACVTDTETNYWFVGEAGAGGIKCVCVTNLSYATGSGLPTISTSSGAGVRIAELYPTNNNITASSPYNGTLIFSDWLATPGAGLYTANGEPEPANGGSAPATLLISTGSGSQPNDFAISPDGTTAYICDDRAFTSTSSQAGGIQRWDLEGGTWTFSYTLPASSGSGTNGARNLAVDFSAHGTWGQGVLGAHLYATAAGITTNSLISMTDNGTSSTLTVLATAGTNQILRGLRFGPSVAPTVGFLSPPTNQVVPAGSEAVFSVTAFPAAGPFTYAWSDGTKLLANGSTGTGSTIIGANTSTLTVSNVSASDIGSYTVVVSNPNSSASATADLDLAINMTQQPTNQFLQLGATATFRVAATGNGTLSYQWYSNGVAMVNTAGVVSGVQTPTLTILDVQSNEIAGYYVEISDTFVATTNSQTAYLELAAKGTGTGLVGQYWTSTTETNNLPLYVAGPPTVTEIDPEVNFTYAEYPWAPPAISQTEYVVIWSGEVQPLYSDTYTFTTICDDGCMLFVNGQQLVFNWVAQSATSRSGSISLVAGQQYSIVMQYFQSTANAEAELYWSSANYEPNQIIPQSQLYPATPPSFVSQPVSFTNANQSGPLFFNGGSVSGVLPISYQWYSNGVAMTGQTNVNFNLASTPLSLNGATLTLIASNSFGAATNNGTSLQVNSGYPYIFQDIQSSGELVGATIALNVQIQGTQPNFQWTYNGTNLTDNSRVYGSHSNILTIAQAFESDSGTYQLFMTNSSGNNQSSAATLGITRIELGNGGGWQEQQTGLSDLITNQGFVLTDGGDPEVSSAYVNFPLYIGAFEASWTYQDVGGAGTTTADGWSFAIQNSSHGPAALGANGDDIGISGITPSWEMEFNIFPSTPGVGGVGGVGMAFDTNGLIAASGGAGGVFGNAFSPTGSVAINNGNPINVSLLYYDDVMDITLHDTVAGTSYSTTQNVNLASVLGTNMAYIGFTGADGTDGSSQQTITNFFFSPLPSLSVQHSGTNVLVGWQAATAPGFVLQQNAALNTTNWVNVPTSLTLTNGQFQVLVPASGQDLYYRLRLP